MSTVTVYTAAQATDVAQVTRQKIDAACATGALKAADAKPDSRRRSWRILDHNLADWIERGMPAK